MNPMLRPLGWLYGRIINIRNSLYDRGIFKSHSLGARTISIGNITTGGTGKTPLVAYVSEILAKNGERVCILTRGYGRKTSDRVLVSDRENVLVDASEGGDEPVELARRLLGKAIVVADADRVSAAEWARNEFDVTAFVLDDGFQHRRARRDLDIVCIDATKPFGGDRTLPAGRLREPLTNLARADAFVITRTDLVESIEDVVDKVRSENEDAPLFGAEFRLDAVTRLQDFLQNVTTPDDCEERQFAAGLFAFCGLGNPEGFRQQLEHFKASGLMTFDDHYQYTQSDIERIEARAREHGSAGLLTTAKDAVKLSGLEFTMPCFVAEIEVMINNAAGFRDLVLSA